MRMQQFPADIAEFLLSLPAENLRIPKTVLEYVLARAPAYIVKIPRGARLPDRRISASSHPYFPYFIWVRTFESETPGTSGYLVDISIACNLLGEISQSPPNTAAMSGCADPLMSRLSSGLRAYRKIAGQPIEDVTAQLTPPEQVLGKVALEHYERLGAGGPFLDDSRLDTVPVARWIVESDPENPLPKDGNTYDGGYLAHAGFLLWNGDHFETRASVSTALWPCPSEHLSCHEDDRFVTNP